MVSVYSAQHKKSVYGNGTGASWYSWMPARADGKNYLHNWMRYKPLQSYIHADRCKKATTVLCCILMNKNPSCTISTCWPCFNLLTTSACKVSSHMKLKL